MKRIICATLLSSVLLAPAAQAEGCKATTTTASYLSCAGSFVGNLNGDASEVSALGAAFPGTWIYKGKSDDSGSGPFKSNPGTATGTLTFDNAIHGEFVIGLKAGNHYSYYEFDAGPTGITTISYDTLGIAVNKNGAGKDLGHAALYEGVSAVPEPASIALLVAGLAIVGLGRRRMI